MSRSSQDPPQATSDARSDLFESGPAPTGWKGTAFQVSGNGVGARSVAAPFHTIVAVDSLVIDRFRGAM